MRKGPDADVLVVGAGIFGLACAHACAGRGWRVIVTEADRPGAGASGGLVGALSPHLPDRWTDAKAFQRDALAAAPAWWGGVAARAGIDPGYAPLGRLLPLGTEAAREQAQARSAEAARNWAGIARWDVLDRGAAPWLDPEATRFGVVHETLSARITPRRALAALQRAIEAQGGEVRAGWRAEALVQGGLRFGAGTLHAPWIILAAGTGLAALRPELPTRGVKGQAALLATPALRDMPLVQGDGLYIVPQPGDRVAIGSTSETDWTDPTGTDAQLDAVIARARALCPSLAEAPVVERWAALRPRGRRPDPMLGPLPGHPGVLVAGGGFKIGFGLAPAVASVIADMVAGLSPALPRGFRLEDHLASGVRP